MDLGGFWNEANVAMNHILYGTGFYSYKSGVVLLGR